MCKERERESVCVCVIEELFHDRIRLISFFFLCSWPKQSQSIEHTQCPNIYVHVVPLK